MLSCRVAKLLNETQLYAGLYAAQQNWPAAAGGVQSLLGNNIWLHDKVSKNCADSCAAERCAHKLCECWYSMFCENSLGICVRFTTNRGGRHAGRGLYVMLYVGISKERKLLRSLSIELLCSIVVAKTCNEFVKMCMRSIIQHMNLDASCVTNI